jgi:hypothetical protein
MDVATLFYIGGGYGLGSTCQESMSLNMYFIFIKALPYL